jgi:hypothetical protein
MYSCMIAWVPKLLTCLFAVPRKCYEAKAYHTSTGVTGGWAKHTGDSAASAALQPRKEACTDLPATITHPQAVENAASKTEAAESVWKLKTEIAQLQSETRVSSLRAQMLRTQCERCRHSACVHDV